jgi:hypothetical protein
VHGLVMTLEVICSGEAAATGSTLELFGFLLIMSGNVGLEIKLALRG